MTNAPALTDERAQLIEVADDFQVINDLCRERKWSDGLPVVPPTEKLVDQMLGSTARLRYDIVARIAPGFGAATVERIAINAVLAGCHPSYLPVLIAAVEAVTAPEFKLQSNQTTTQSVAVWIIVNGPIAKQLEINGGCNCLGQGARANATIGRALRLVLQNIGSALPGEMDRSTQGCPGKFTFCCAENEAESPWEPLQVERGFELGSSTVTVIGASGTLNMHTYARDAEDLLRQVSESLIFPPSNDYWAGGEPWLVLSPEHAAILSRAGLSKLDVKRRLWDASLMSAGRMAPEDLKRTHAARAAELGFIDENTMLPISRKPEDIGIIVAGGPGAHSVYVPTFGDTRSVTRKIALPRRV